MSLSKKSKEELNENEFLSRGRYDSDSKAYWNWAIKRFGDSKDALNAILHCGGTLEYNIYMDFIQKRALSKFIKKSNGKDVLDVGCGVGRWSLLFAGSGARVIGIDFSDEMLKVAERNAKLSGCKCKFLKMNVVNLDFSDDSFDLVNCAIVLMHIKNNEDFKKSLQEMIRVTKPGGILLLSKSPL